MNLHQWFCGGKEPCACMDSWKAMTDEDREREARFAMLGGEQNETIGLATRDAGISARDVNPGLEGFPPKEGENQATGAYSFATGLECSALHDRSIAMGYRATTEGLDSGEVRFSVLGDELLLLRADGRILVRGQEVGSDAELVGGLREWIRRTALQHFVSPTRVKNRDRSEFFSQEGESYADGFFVEKRKQPRFGTLPEGVKAVLHVGDFSRGGTGSYENALRAMTADQALKLAELLVEHAREILES